MFVAMGWWDAKLEITPLKGLIGLKYSFGGVFANRLA
jgi:hypothetical protein